MMGGKRCGASRSLGPTRVCAIHVRGGMRCAWCGVKYSGRDDASIDHLDGDPSNNDSTNLVSSCVGCNSSRAHEWPALAAWSPGAAWQFHDPWERFAAYLHNKGTTLDAGIRRAQRQRAELLDLAAGRALARRWYPSYRDRCNAAMRAYRWRKSPEGRAEIEKAQAFLYGSKTLAEVG